MEEASQRFNRINANVVTSEVHRSSPTMQRLHMLLGNEQMTAVCDVACGAGHLSLSFARRAGG
jgi:2-polyprenyl-3-methyl-5-hydroxy-6-metoxy-1,4-benzoquinol methylase